MNEADKRRTIDVGTRWNQVTPVAAFYKAGLFSNRDEAIGAFKLAHQQVLDGMGKDLTDWMGLSVEELDAWTRQELLPGETQHPDY